MASGQVPAESAKALLTRSKAEQDEIIAEGPEAVAQVRREVQEAERAPVGDLEAQLAELQGVFSRMPAVVQEVHARLIFEVSKKALAPEQLQELAALWPPEPPAYDGAGNVALIRLGDELKREQPRNQKLHAFCKAVESDIASRGAAQQRTIHG